MKETRQGSIHRLFSHLFLAAAINQIYNSSNGTPAEITQQIASSKRSKTMTTETRNPNTMDLDIMSPLEVVTAMNREDEKVPREVEAA